MRSFAIKQLPQQQHELQYNRPQAQRGFTLVELITVVIVLGIVALIALPRFASTDTYAEFALQQRLQTALRTLQIQSMYDTRPNFCYQLNFAAGTSAGFGPGFGPATDNYQNGNQALSCSANINYNVAPYLRSDANELSQKGIDIVALDSGSSMSSIEFNALGQAISNVGSCAAGCEISFVGEDSAKLCISAEGYIHACR